MVASTSDDLRVSAQDGYVALFRASSLARRPGIVILQEDLETLTTLAGSTAGARALIWSLQRQGRLRRVRRGAYVLADASGGMRARLLDLIAALTPGPYLVTAGRALQFHELSDQHFRRVQVLAPTQLRSWSWRGDTVRYARTDRSLRGEGTRTRKTRANVATAERAIADSLARPEWGVTLSQVIQALEILLARDPFAADRLAVQAAAYDSHALARRLGFLVSRLSGEDAARPFAPLRGSSKAAIPLRAGGPGSGSIDQTWKVRENVDITRLGGGGQP